VESQLIGESVVTWNARDFTVAGLRGNGPQKQTPDLFLTRLRDRSPGFQRVEGSRSRMDAGPYPSRETVSARPLLTDRHTASKAATVAIMSASPIG